MATRLSGRIADEQATLRRVATLVAGGASPEAVFAVVAEEVGRLLGADLTIVGRYDPDGAVTAVGAWSGTGAALPIPDTRACLGDRNTATLVFRNRRPARIDDYANASGPPAENGRGWALRSTVGAPISIEGRLWGVLTVASTRAESLPADTEGRLADFTQLVGTAIANAQARVELRGVAEEQAALRRMATLVARAAPEEVFAAVTAEVARVLSADVTIMNRYDPDGTHTAVGAWSSTGTAGPFTVGTRAPLGGRNVISQVFATGRPARMDDYADASGPTADIARGWGARSVVGVPISVEGRLWGVTCVGSGREPLPADTEERLAAFTELVATAIANAQARMELRSHAEEQAALRRVATLVARAAPPAEVFAAVTAELGRVLSADVALMSRYGPDDTATIVSAWTSTGAAPPTPVGSGFELGGRNVHTLVFHTGRPARMPRAEASGAATDVFREWGIRTAVGAPIGVGGRLWGVMSVLSTHEEPLPADTEARLAGFTELVATALADAETQVALTASRARIVAAGDATRRRIERDLHDGAQQRLVSLALHLRGTVRAAVPPEATELTARLDAVASELAGVLDELRELARGLHPSALADGGLRPALKALARRSAVPVRLEVRVDGRLPDQVELAAYYTVAETLTNTAAHASATVIDVEVETGEGVLRVRVRDDGRGGADLTGGSGLVELTDRVEALGGRLSLHSPPGGGTRVQVSLPVTAAGTPASPAAEAGP
ncbi:GAF domain-containing sensor histidine kinase [Actinophytocola sp.]|uniref:sensor histidine kinase n=1 Tax=Actinophytocola sp. TaxID=1872138 RepID=UPI002ED89C16